MRLRLRNWLIALLMLGSAPFALGQWQTQTLSLAPGWNGVYLHVDCSHESILNQVTGTAVEEIWLWQPQTTAAQYVTNPDQPADAKTRWASWKATDIDGSSLQNLVGNAAYLFKVTGDATVTLNLKGKPVPPQYSWTTSGLNLLGLPSRSTGTPPALEDYFSPAGDLLRVSQIFAYGGGDLSANNPAQVYGLRTTPAKRGQAFWIRSGTRYNRYFGPFEIKLQNTTGVHFGDNLSTFRVRLKNLTRNDLTVTLNSVASAPPPSGETVITGDAPVLVRGALDISTLTYGHAALSAGAQSWTLKPNGKAGSEVEVILGLNRNTMTSVGSLYASILRFTDSLNHSQVDLPVTGTVGVNSGLWVGDVQVDRVQHSLASDSESYGTVSRKYPLRLILHKEYQNVTTTGAFNISTPPASGSNRNIAKTGGEEEEVDESPTITLIGDNPATLLQNASWTEPGYSAQDYQGNDLTSDVVVDFGLFDASVIGASEIRYGVQDNNTGKATVVRRTVNIVAPTDITAPTIALLGNSQVLHPINTPYTDAGATAQDVNNVDGTTTDITGSIHMNTSDVDVTKDGTYKVTFNVSDAAGNAATEVQRTVVVYDNSDSNPPVVTLNSETASITIEAGTDLTTVAAIGATATDDVDGTIPVVPTGGPQNSMEVGTYTVTYTATDSSGNSGTATLTIVIQDTTAPTLTLLGQAAITIQAGNTFTDPGTTAFDTLDGDITSSVQVTGAVDTGALGAVTLTYNVSDLAGNAADAVTRTVTVVDTTPPTISLVGPASLEVAFQGTFTDQGVTVTDNYDSSITPVTTGSVNVNELGTYQLTYTATDSSGNSAVVARVVTVGDTQAPVITLNGEPSVTIEAGSDYTDAGATASDNVDGDISANVATNSTVVTGTPGTYQVNYTVVDSSSNSAAVVTRTVIVQDTTAPVIALTGGATISHEGATQFSDPGFTVTDNATGDLASSVTVSGTVVTGTVGNYELTFNVSDASGNAATPVVRTVNVVDTTIPVITLTGSATVTHEAGTAYTDQGATAADTVDGNISANVNTAGTVNHGAVGTYTLTYSVSDAAGNAATEKTRTVNVVDTTAPVITRTGDEAINHEAGSSYVHNVTAADNLDGDITSQLVITGSVNVNALGVYNLSYAVSDANGNAATAVTRIVTVRDTTGPTITLNGSATESVYIGRTYTDPGTTVSDNLDASDSLTVAATGSVDTTTIGSYTLSYNVSDATGNAATEVTRTVNVVPVSIAVSPTTLPFYQGDKIKFPNNTVLTLTTNAPSNSTALLGEMTSGTNVVSGASGRADRLKLLQRVYVGTLTNNLIGLATKEALLKKAELASARRISSVHLPFSATNNGWTCNGDVIPGQTITTRVNIEYNDQASNPFVHTYHPDHDNLSPSLSSPSVEPIGKESYKIQRDITLTVNANGTDFRSLSRSGERVTGVYDETITIIGLQTSSGPPNQKVYRVRGKFTLYQISKIGHLTAN